MRRSNVYRGVPVTGEPVPVRGKGTASARGAGRPGSDEEPLLHSARELAAGREQAFAAGLHEGEQRGRAAERQRLRQVAASLDAMSTTLGQERTGLLQQVRDDLVKLALAMAAKLAHRALVMDEETALRAVTGALEHVGNASRIRVRVNPADLEAVRAHSAELGELLLGEAHLELRGDPVIGAGGAVVETDEVQLDATLEGLLSRFAEALEDWRDQEALVEQRDQEGIEKLPEHEVPKERRERGALDQSRDDDLLDKRRDKEAHGKRRDQEDIEERRKQPTLDEADTARNGEARRDAA